jgi:hypothetical protein
MLESRTTLTISDPRITLPLCAPRCSLQGGLESQTTLAISDPRYSLQNVGALQPENAYCIFTTSGERPSFQDRGPGPQRVARNSYDRTVLHNYEKPRLVEPLSASNGGAFEARVWGEPHELVDG